MEETSSEEFVQDEQIWERGAMVMIRCVLPNFVVNNANHCSCMWRED
jgi:hypothetical protein